MHGAGRIKFSIPFTASPQRIVKIKIKLTFSLCPGLGREGLTQVFEKNKLPHTNYWNHYVASSVKLFLYFTKIKQIQCFLNN